MKDTKNTNMHKASNGTSFVLHELDDVFTFENDSSNDTSGVLAPGNSEYSDLPHLKLVHETNGYRDGIIRGKEKSVQEGFDFGYQLGAILGLRVGMILGLLEGMVQGIKSHDEQQEVGKSKQIQADFAEGDADMTTRIGLLWKEAQNELILSKLIDAKWWDKYGFWCYEVLDGHSYRRISSGGDNYNGGSDGDDDYKTGITLEEVANAHPLVEGWQKLIEDEVQKWGLDLKIFDQDPQKSVKIFNSETSREKVKNWSGKSDGISRTNSNMNDTSTPSTTHLNW